jgi:sortase A
MKTSRWLRRAQYMFTGIAILALGYCAAVWVDSRFYQARESLQFDRERLLKDVRAMRPRISLDPASPEDGQLLGRLEIPRLGLSVMVVQGDRSGDLKRAIGHIPGTAFPGQPGNVGIAGHRDTFFRPLRDIRPNDNISLTYLGGTSHYRVVATKVVDPEDVQVLYPTGKDTLTLVTCFPFNYVGSAPRRFIVKAERLS